METWVRCEENGRRLIECPEGNNMIGKEYYIKENRIIGKYLSKFLPKNR